MNVNKTMYNQPNVNKTMYNQPNVNKTMYNELLNEIKKLRQDLNLVEFHKSRKNIHLGIHCNGCGRNPLTGIRYKCLMCPNFNFCEICESNYNSSESNVVHDTKHFFVKIRNTDIYNFVCNNR
jgi:hypothetical protein